MIFNLSQIILYKLKWDFLEPTHSDWEITKKVQHPCHFATSTTLVTAFCKQQLLQVCLTKCKPNTKPKGASPNSTAQSSSNQGQALNCWKDTLVCYSHYSHYWVTTVSVDGPEDYDKWSKPFRWDHRVIPSMMICESPFHLPAVWLPFLRNSMQLEGQFLDQQDSHHQKTSWQEPL